MTSLCGDTESLPFLPTLFPRIKYKRKTENGKFPCTRITHLCLDEGMLCLAPSVLDRPEPYIYRVDLVSSSNSKDLICVDVSGVGWGV
ncbi:hypothetical protein HMI54_007336 [Coelomomyces lativittatus]|nr:hypothetical protein HMI54_007336 [Coelomomyces lativittatus]